MAKESESYLFIIGDKLPTYYDVAISLFEVCTRREGEKARSTLISYYTALMNVWTKSFGEGHRLTRKSIMKKLEKVCDSYYNEVYTKCSRKTQKRPNQPISTIRQQNKVWRQKVINKDGDTNSSLFDIGVEMNSLTGEHQVFYQDQKSGRRFRISEEIDQEYVKQKENEWLTQQLENENQERELEAMEDDTLEKYEPMDFTPSLLNQSINRSGFSRNNVSIESVATQTSPSHMGAATYEAPRDNERVCSDKCKSTCATLSTVVGLSVESSRKALQIVGTDYYGDELYLTKKEADEAVRKASGNEPPLKKVKGDKLKRVIASAKTINNYKHMQASQVERDAGLALLNKQNDVKSTLHYDTTSRCHIDGEWPSIILSFSDGRDFELRPIFFAYEDREQIALLVVETLKRLAVASTESELCAQQLWENLHAIMTDAVSKNLHIEDIIAGLLGSTHKPLHLLCKSHTVEKLDVCNLEVLAKFEKKLNQRDVLEGINPRLKSFFRGKKTTVEAGIEALLNLVYHKSSAKPSSHGETFDFICEREKVVKRLFLYQQRRFTKLGKSAASLLAAYPILQMVVDEVKETNQLVESCRIYLASEIFKTELEVLAYFTQHVTFPFLNCVEKSSQEELLALLPKLHSDLKAKKVDTLSQFEVEMRHVPVHEPTTDLGFKLLNLMCISAADGVMLQCGGEYGFAGESSNRASDLSLLTKEERKGLPNNNLKCERHLSVFDNRSGKVAKCRNQKFSAKSIRNDVMLFRKVQGFVDPATRLVTKLLDERESLWTEKQKEILKERITEKLQKTIYFNVMLKNC